MNFAYARQFGVLRALCGSNRKRTMKNTTTILLIIGIIVLVNVLSNSFFHRFDLTENGEYTTSKATKDILRNLSEPVTITAYFTDDLPPQYAKHKRDVQDMLIEYNNTSKGNVAYEFIDPLADEAKEQEALQNGIQPVLANMREKDQVKQQKIYMGAVLQMGDQTDVIPFIQPGAAMEYSLSRSIKKLAVIDKPAVGLVQGHGEPGLQEMAQVYQELSILYSLQPLQLNENIPAQYKTIAIVAPKDSIPTNHFAVLDEFLGRGGNIFIANNAVQGDFSTAQGTALTTGLEGWLQQKGLQIQSAFVTDSKCGSITVSRGGGGFFQMRQQVQFPYLPTITNFADHPLSKGLERVTLQFASPMSFTGDTSGDKQFTPIAFTSKKSGSTGVPLQFDVMKQWTDRDFPLSDLIVGGILEGKFVNDFPAKMVVISDGDFAINGSGQQQQRLEGDNVSLMVNSIDWLSDDTGLIELRTKAVTSRPIEQIDDSKKNFYKYLNFLLPVGLVILYGFIRAQRRRAKRMKQMQESYA